MGRGDWYCKVRCPLCCSDGHTRGPVAYYVRSGDGRDIASPPTRTPEQRAFQSRMRTQRKMGPPPPAPSVEAQHRSESTQRIDAMRARAIPPGRQVAPPPAHLAPAIPGAGPWTAPADRQTWSETIAFTCERHPRLRRMHTRGDIIKRAVDAVAEGYTTIDFDGNPMGRRRRNAA